MIRLPLVAALATCLLWCPSGPTAAQDAKQPEPAKAEAKQPEPKGGISPQTAKINEFIAKGWAEAPGGGVKQPAAKATDHEFMRRVFIDLIGRIPTPDEIRDFENDRTGGNKRTRLVQRLLNNTLYEIKDQTGKSLTEVPGIKLATSDKKRGIDYEDAFAQNFAELWTTWMLTRSNTHPQYREQLGVWLTSEFYKDTPWDAIVRELIGASGRTGTNNATVFVLRHLGDPIVTADDRKKGDKEDFAKNGKFDAVPITSRVTKLFLGIQSQCVQCHNHPFNKEYVQSDFWGINAFFRQTDRSGNTNAAANLPTVPQLELRDVAEWNMEPVHPAFGGGKVLFERRDGQKGATAPAMLRHLAQFAAGEKFSGKQLTNGQIPSEMAGMTRRQVLGKWVTDHDNFGRAFVNRMWGHLFGRGLNVEPTLDDFSSNNAVVHPELLNYLGEQFKQYNYDPKKLLEWICTSDVYNLSHVANKTYADQKYDPYFARMPLKAMSPEVMFDSLAVATRAESRKDATAYRAFKTAWTQKLTQNFGDDEGNEINFNGTVVQALLMMNGKEINGEIGSAKKGSGGAVDEVVKRLKNTNAIYHELFLMTVSRHPSDTEIKQLEAVRQNGVATPAPKGKGPIPKGGPPVVGPAAADDVTFYQDVFWALLNSSEFLLNH